MPAQSTGVKGLEAHFHCEKHFFKASENHGKTLIEL